MEDKYQGTDVRASFGDRNQGRRTATSAARARELNPERGLNVDPPGSRSLELRTGFLDNRTECHNPYARTQGWLPISRLCQVRRSLIT
jgi:hypothetical protein